MMNLVRARVGRRGTFLLFLALLDILYGWSLLGTPLGTSLHLILPLTAWAWVWIGTGFALVPGAFLRQDRMFFGVAALIKAAWAGAWVSVWMYDPMIPRAWVSVVIWGAFAGVVLVISTWPEVFTVKGRDMDV